MSTAKKSVSTKVEELRSFGEAVEGTALEGLDKWLTPEFWTMAVASVGNVVAVLALIGWLEHSQVETVTKALTALISASEVILVNGLLIWKYIAGRQEIAQQVMASRLRMREDVAYAKLQIQQTR